MIDIDCKHFRISNMLRLCAKKKYFAKKSSTFNQKKMFEVKIRRAFHARYKSPFFRINHNVFLHQFSFHHNKLVPLTIYKLNSFSKKIKPNSRILQFQEIIEILSETFLCPAKLSCKHFFRSFFIYMVFETNLDIVICS